MKNAQFHSTLLPLCTALGLVLLACPQSFAAPPVVTNVVASQRAVTKLVDIRYDVQDADDDLLKIRVEISDNDGTLYSIPAFSLTGDIGEGIAPGTDKHIVWDAGVDWDGEYSDRMRVKVFAIDAQGYPGMEWGNEIPPGGFLMGQDGGAEGAGASRHVNVPWSCWLSKYEITAQQYCAFLNAALVAGHVTRSGTTAVFSKSDAPLFRGLQGEFQLLSIGDSNDIRWNVNNFEVVNNRTNFPVRVTWHGALAFAHFYGYDLPTEAEWEKAARGPDHDDADEHLVYTWGDTMTGGYCNYLSSGDPYTTASPVGYYDGNQTPLGPDTANGYGLYDMIGNLSEWTLSLSGFGIETYPQQENIWTNCHLLISSGNRVTKGGNYNSALASPELKIYNRLSYAPTAATYTGFRVVRRNPTIHRAYATCTVFENFDAWPARESSNPWTYTTPDGVWNGAYLHLRTDGANAASGTKYLYGMNSSFSYLYPPLQSSQLVMLRAKVKNPSSSNKNLSLRHDGSSAVSSVTIPAYTPTYYTVSLPVTVPSTPCYLRFDSDYMYADDIELWTVPSPE